jgi:hypothetical protein
VCTWRDVVQARNRLSGWTEPATEGKGDTGCNDDQVSESKEKND